MIEALLVSLGFGAAAAGVACGLALHPRSPIGAPVVRRDPAGGVRITFDDGPDPEWTPRVLDRLAAIGARASFFVLGDRVDRYPELVRACAAAGHEIEIHGMSHRAATFQWPASLAREIATLSDSIEELTQRRPRWYRPPYGARPMLSSAIRPLRLVTWSWSCGDWPGGADNGARFPRVRAGDVVLLHDGPSAAPGARARTLGALEALAATSQPLVALGEP